MNPIYYVILAGVFAGTFQVARKVIPSQGLSPLFGATMFSLAAGLMGMILLLQSKFNFSNISSKNWLSVLGAGLLVLPIDFFILKAYQKGFSLSAGAIVITGVSGLIAVLIGAMVLNENLKLGKIIGIFLILAGIFILKSTK
jgi:uncharacterized membrane protein